MLMFGFSRALRTTMRPMRPKNPSDTHPSAILRVAYRIYRGESRRVRSIHRPEWRGDTPVDSDVDLKGLINNDDVTSQQ